MTQTEMCLSDSPTSQCVGKVAEPGGAQGLQNQVRQQWGHSLRCESGCGEWGEGVIKETVLSNVGGVYS